jgi:hypothetical protein
MSEIFTVDFEVQKRVQKSYGYEELYLSFRGKPIGYKAILRNGRLMAIVTRGYKLIPHEEVEAALMKAGLEIVSKEDAGPRAYYVAKVPNRDDFRIFVVNSVDGSRALMLRYVFIFEGFEFVVTRMSEKIGEVKKIHKKYAEASDIPEIVANMVASADQIKAIITQTFKLPAKPFKETWDYLKDQIPEKYTRYVIARLYVRGEDMTVGDVYREIYKRIWQSNNTMQTKLTFLNRLNEVLWIIAELGELM